MSLDWQRKWRRPMKNWLMQEIPGAHPHSIPGSWSRVTLHSRIRSRPEAQLQSMITSTETAIGSFHSAVSIWAEEMEPHIVARDAETEGAASYAQTVTIAATVGTCCSAQFYLL